MKQLSCGALIWVKRPDQQPNRPPPLQQASRAQYRQPQQLGCGLSGSSPARRMRHGFSASENDQRAPRRWPQGALAEPSQIRRRS